MTHAQPALTVLGGQNFGPSVIICLEVPMEAGMIGPRVMGRGLVLNMARTCINR